MAILGSRGIPNAYGGFEQFAEQLALGLVGYGYQVTVYNPIWHPYKKDEYLGVKIVRKRCPERRLGAAAHFIYDYLCLRDALSIRQDIILELGYGTSAISYFLLPVGKSVIVTNMDGLEWKRDKWNRATKSVMRLFERAASRKSHYLVADNRGIKDYLYSKYKRNAFFIPYGADTFEVPNKNLIKQYSLGSDGYFMAMARFEPENNLHMILDGYCESGSRVPFVVVGNPGNKYGEDLKSNFADRGVRFLGGIYDADVIDNLRYFSKLYFHGHSVGGTNPSLLEAMACGARIRAHDNLFNRYVLGENALYFKSSPDVARLIERSELDRTEDTRRCEENYGKIRGIYSWDSVVEQYMRLFERIAKQGPRSKEAVSNEGPLQ